MKILISGISGFVGEYLAKQINKNYPQAQIFGIERNIRQFELFPELNSKVKILSCDITDVNDVSKTISKVKPDEFYHLAGFSSANTNDRKLVFDINVKGTISILKALEKTGKKVKVVLVSSSYVYGNTPKPAKENSKINPHGIYAESKAEMEKEAKKFIDILDIMTVRPVNHTGPGQRQGFVVPDFASQIINLKNKDEISVGNLTAKRDFLDVKEVVKAYTIVMKKGKSGQIYNISSGKCQTVKSILENLIKLSGKKIKVKIDSKKVRPVDIKKNCLDPSEIKKLGWKNSLDIRNTLKAVLKYWKEKKQK